MIKLTKAVALFAALAYTTSVWAQKNQPRVWSRL